MIFKAFIAKHAIVNGSQIIDQKERVIINSLVEQAYLLSYEYFIQIGLYNVEFHTYISYKCKIILRIEI